ncbi:gliding motility-associated C-terminal domain-containing protein [Bacteroidales bacterium OttesenSCG-928-B11]|nr:gliding motility-associated C-terminal domain-containing protein [Bacteroidales bacterium OttesenSCG-928-C03]MDL2312038.1 gliding motility-associated C-terminal domain-containing protein [Bacteroidales bacterium OttesenSCG-928-B11]
MEKELKDFLRDYEVQPSERCWEAIDQQLAAMQQPSSQSQPDGSAAQQTGSSIKQAILQKSGAFWAKTAAIITTSIAVGTVAVVAIMNSNQDITPLAKEQEPVISAKSDTTVIPIGDTVMIDIQDVKTISAVMENRKSVIEEPQIKDINTTHSAVVPVAASPAVNQSIDNQSGMTTTTVTTTTPQQPAKPQPEAAVYPASQIPAPSIKEDPENSDLQPEIQEDNTPAVIIEIPNVFTPNGDGINDYFEILGLEHCTRTELIIRDANRKVVYHAKHYENNWNGEYLENGTYYYTFSYEIGEDRQIRQGVVMIIR